MEITPILIKDLENGILDLVIPTKSSSLIKFEASPKEKSILIAGSKIDTTEVQKFIQKKELSNFKKYLRTQI